MHHFLIRLVSILLLLGVTVPDALSQKRTKKRAARSHRVAKHPAPVAATLPAADISTPLPESTWTVPQQNSLTPGMKKTRKVVIVPAPPPPPGRDPLPPYPKR